MQLKERIVDLATHRHMSIAELERKLNFANGSISKWDKQSPSAERLQAVADYFDVSTDYLLGRNDSKKGKTSNDPADVSNKDVVLSFEGKIIPPEDMETIRRFLRGGNYNDK